jgi:hypothetical protein
VKTERPVVAEFPDLIDTGYSNDNTTNMTLSAPLVDDSFADVSFHSGESKGQADDLFTGMTVGSDKQSDHASHKQGTQSDPQFFDIFASSSKLGNHNESVGDLMGGLSIDENTSSSTKQKGTYSTVQSESLFSGLNNHAPENTLGSTSWVQWKPDVSHRSSAL